MSGKIGGSGQNQNLNPTASKFQEIRQRFEGLEAKTKSGRDTGLLNLRSHRVSPLSSGTNNGRVNSQRSKMPPKKASPARMVGRPHPPPRGIRQSRGPKGGYGRRYATKPIRQQKAPGKAPEDRPLPRAPRTEADDIEIKRMHTELKRENYSPSSPTSREEFKEKLSNGQNSGDEVVHTVTLAREESLSISVSNGEFTVKRNLPPKGKQEEEIAPLEPALEREAPKGVSKTDQGLQELQSELGTLKEGEKFEVDAFGKLNTTKALGSASGKSTSAREVANNIINRLDASIENLHRMGIPSQINHLQSLKDILNQLEKKNPRFKNTLRRRKNKDLKNRFESIKGKIGKIEELKTVLIRKINLEKNNLEEHIPQLKDALSQLSEHGKGGVFFTENGIEYLPQQPQDRRAAALPKEELIFLAENFDISPLPEDIITSSPDVYKETLSTITTMKQYTVARSTFIALGENLALQQKALSRLNLSPSDFEFGTEGSLPEDYIEKSKEGIGVQQEKMQQTEEKPEDAKIATKGLYALGKANTELQKVSENYKKILTKLENSAREAKLKDVEAAVRLLRKATESPRTAEELNAAVDVVNEYLKKRSSV